MRSDACGCRVARQEIGRAVFPRHDDGVEPVFAPRTGVLPAESRRINWRWLAACTLIGLSGAGLLGSALQISRTRNLAARRPVRASVAGPNDSAGARSSRKGDSLLKQSFAISSALHFRAPLTETAGGQEIIKVHAIAHVSVGLSPLPVAALDIPPIETVQLGAAAPPETSADSVDPADADVSITRRDLAEAGAGDESLTLTDEAVVAQVAELAKLTAAGSGLPPGFSEQRMLSRTLRLGAELLDAQEATAKLGRFGALDVRIVPENLTSARPGTDATERFEEVDLTLGRGVSLAALLAAQGASAERSEAIVAALGRGHVAELREGQHLRLTIGPGPSGRTIQRLMLFDENGPQRVVAETDQGAFVDLGRPGGPLAERTIPKSKAQEEQEGEDDVTLYQSAYAGALKSEVPRDVIEEAVRAFATGTDLRQAVAAGDRLELVYTEDETGAGSQHVLLFAALTAGDETQAAYPFASADGASRDYLDENGVSRAKLLLRRPVQVGRISSPFGMRYHPILHYSRLHNGVDWAAPRGTPIMAAGDGTVVAAGARSGYGNRVELQHSEGYASAYNHLASIGRNITPGTHVHMGDIVGYVGTTGLATGPHVHYEVTANGHFVDPMKVRLPSRRTLTGASLAAFQAKRRQVDDLRRHGGRTAVAAGVGLN